MKQDVLVAALVFMAAAGGVGFLQPRLARAAHSAGDREDVYALPPPEQLRAATLGWRAAAVDGLWAKLLVEYGTHWTEHREFYDTTRYADAILELEPGFLPLYKYIDTMLVYRPLHGTADDARAARAYLQRGVREHPLDSKLWLELGQFEAFMGRTFLSDPQEVAAWTEDGAAALERAVELGESPDRTLTAAALLTRAGQISAALAYLERAYAFTQHPSMADLHEAIGQRIEILRQLRGQEAESSPSGEPPRPLGQP